jgi:predicted nucleic acid-binding protein
MPELLLDLSAWARSSHPDVVDRWAELVRDDRLVCHPVFLIELLHNAINSQRYVEMRRNLDDAFDWVYPDAETAEIALRLQQRMASGGALGQRVKTADLLIAALAVQHGVGVLHYDGDYDLIRDRGGEPFQSEWLASRGSLEAVAGTAASARKAFRKAFGERMVQLQDGTDLEVWPKAIAWIDGQLEARDLPVPPPPDLD